MFVITSIVISLLTIKEFLLRNKKNSFLFLAIIIFLTVLLCFRYGQGTDYHEYELQYNSLVVTKNIFSNQLHHGEIGWFILMLAFKSVGFDFYWFIGIISFIMMLLLWRSIRKYSPSRFLSVLLFFPTFYMTYYFSAIRQGLVLSIFLGVGLGLLLKRKTFKYLILAACLSLVHYSSILLILLPFIVKMRSKKTAMMGMILAFVFFALGYFGFLGFVGEKLNISSYLTRSFSPLAVILRLVFFSIAVYLHKYYKKYSNSKVLLESTLFKIYTFGFIVFVALSFSSNLSQRLTMPLKAVEVFLFPILLKNYRLHVARGYVCRKNARLTFTLILFLFIFVLNFELVKNLDSYIVQGNYFADINSLSFPWINIFNRSRIWEYISSFD